MRIRDVFLFQLHKIINSELNRTSCSNKSWKQRRRVSPDWITWDEGSSPPPLRRRNGTVSFADSPKGKKKRKMSGKRELILGPET